MAHTNFPRPSTNDLVLLLTLTYSGFDILSEWATFSTCRKPVHQWLLASYIWLLAFRIVHTVGTHYATTQNTAMAEEFLVNLRLKGTVPQLMMCLIWFIVMPGFLFWTFAGSLWIREVWMHTPRCMPTQFFWFSVLWQLVSYFWIVAHVIIGIVAVSRERKIRLVEADLRALEDPDTLERWGAVSELHSLSASIPYGGNQKVLKASLSASEILRLGGTYKQAAPTSGHSDEECSICLAAFQTGDSLRRLPNCAHTFHRSCIDLWLLQSASCPLCKMEIHGLESEVTCSLSV
jgi:hypothetical protein